MSEIAKRFGKVHVGLSINDRLMPEKAKGFIKKHKPVLKMVFDGNIDMELLKELLLSAPKKFYILYLDVIRAEQIENSMPFPLFLLSVQKIFKSALIDAMYCSGFIPDTKNYPELSKTRCPAGTTKLGLLPDGSVYPCNLFFGIKEFRLGNLLYDNFQDIWQHKKLAFFRTFTGNACPQTSCILHQSCHGGCPAHSLIHFGSLHSPEPRCVRREK